MWKQYQGEVLDGKLLLQEYLGGSDSQGVFLSALGEGEPQKVAVKLIPEDSRTGKRRMQQWKLAEKLSHPHLLRILGSGRAELRGQAMLYVVMEYAEENLEQVILHRALTGPEAHEMLEPTLAALAYLHGEGFVHGHLKPSNLLAVDGRLRVSSDRLCRTGDQDSDKPHPYAPPEMDLEGFSPPGDVWSLGMTLVEALTQKLPVWVGTAPEEPALPDTIPAPFLEIARNCLRRNPRSRWKVADIQKGLRHSEPEAPLVPQEEKRGAPKRLIFALSAVLTVILALVLLGTRFFTRVESSQGSAVAAETAANPPKVETKAEKPPAPVEEKAPPPVEKETPPPVSTAAASPPPTAPVRSSAVPPVVPAPVPVKQKEPAVASTESVTPAEGIQKVMPEVNSKARNSIQGRVRVTVRVHVEASGRVSDAELESPGPSKYFAEQALQAAKRWKFPPGDGSRVFDLPFVIQKNETLVVPVRVRQ